MSLGTIVLKAKLLAPPLPKGHVPRRRLRERLEPARPLTVVTAPAGFGKTVAVTEWLSESSIPSGWLSLDEGDNDNARFFLHLLAALEDARPGCCDSFGRAAGDISEKDVPALIAGVTNQLHATEQPFCVVLDDYHVIDSPAVHQTVGFIVEHMPATMHLVITSRHEPPLPLSRWRMRGRMTELREGDLRFASEEVSSFLNGTMALALAPGQTRLLEKKTEGWIGGLQLAALSLVEREDRDEFLAAFAGDDRYVMDYLTVEVLAGQPPDVRSFLLRTSILERMNDSLCEAVSGHKGCAEILERLERQRIFVVGLDNNRQWYRYHRLFADLLRHQLASSEAEQASTCHLAASVWWEQAGDLSEAARHARLAGDPERLGQLIDTHGMALSMRGRSKQVLVWVRQVPEALLAATPERLEVAMWCEYTRTGQVPASLRARIDAAMRSDPEAGSLARSLAVFEAYEAARDPDRYREAITRASEIGPAPSGEDDFVHVGARAVATCCAHALGDLKAAEAGYARALTGAPESGSVSLFIFLSFGRGRLRALQAGPAAARRAMEESLAVAAKKGWDALPVSATLRLGLAEHLYEIGEHAECEAAYELALSLGEHEPTTTRFPVYLGLARLYWAQGRVDACDEMLRRLDAEPFILPLVPLLPDLGVERARMDLARGRLDDVQAFLEAHGFADDRDQLTGIHGVRDAADLLVGRYLLLRHRYAAAIGVLTRTLQAAVAGGRLDTVVRCRIDLALARYLHGERQQAFGQLDAAVDSALGLDAEDGQPRGYRQVFVDAPEQLRHLVERRLADGIDRAAPRAFLQHLWADAPPDPSRQVEEPLSPSERKVLEHLVGGLTNKEIAQRLFVSPNTVKTHIRRIYGKLGARNRADAIRRARTLGIGQI